MSFYEVSQPLNPAYRVMRPIGNFLHSVARGIQFAREVQALYALSDAQLAQLGITRDEIPQYAQRFLE